MKQTPTPEQITAFRYNLIAAIVSRQTPFASGELRRLLEDIAGRSYDIPGSQKQTIGIRTLERYIADYRNAGWDGLQPKPRNDSGQMKLSAEALQQAIAIRKATPALSVEQIVFMLQDKHPTIAVSTLARQLRKAGFSREAIRKGASSEQFQRFEAEDILLMWQFDYKHFVYLPDPANPKRKRKTMLFAILDDHSRACVHGQLYWDEKLPRTEDSLKKAILKYGIPSQFYCDNGAAFSSHHLARICGRLAIRLSHSKPYRPQGRGKIERFFQFVDSSFKPIVLQEIASGQLTTLADLNAAFTIWLDGYYHTRVHGTTHEPPLTRHAASKKEVKRVSMVELNTIFLWEETRTVDKTDCVSLMGNTYEVETGFARTKVQLRYDPFDLSHVQVWHNGQQLADAKVLETVRKLDRRVSADIELVEEPDGQLSFLEVAQAKREQMWQETGLHYAKEGEAK